MRSFYSPLAISAPFYGYLKLLKLHRTERSRNKDVRSGNRTQDLLHEGRALTDCAILASINTYYYYYYYYYYFYYYYYYWQMQALFASTTSFKVKRATSDLLGLSNKDLLVIPLSILTEILTSQRLFVM